MQRRSGRWLVPMVAVLVLLSLGASLPPLRDLTNHWSNAIIAALAARGLVEGFPDGSFRPDEPITRAQVAKMVSLVLGQAQDAERAALGAGRFADLRGHWARGYAEVLAELGVMQGYPGGLFKPEEPVSRVELVVMAARAAGLSPAAANLSSDFADQNLIPRWALPEVSAAASAGLTREVYPAGRELNPRQPATRAEAGALLARSMAKRGLLFHLTGTVSGWDDETGELRLITPAGETQVVPTTPDTLFFHNGAPGRQVSPPDQVWVVLDAGGHAIYVATGYRDLLGQVAAVNGSVLRMIRSETLSTVEIPVSPAARIFVNGRPAALDAVDGADRVYVVLDEMTDAARIVDAVDYTDYGTLVSYDAATRTMVVQLLNQRAVRLRVREDAIVYVRGQPADPAGIPAGAAVMIYAPDGEVQFVQTDP